MVPVKTLRPSATAFTQHGVEKESRATIAFGGTTTGGGESEDGCVVGAAEAVGEMADVARG